MSMLKSQLSQPVRHTAATVINTGQLAFVGMLVALVVAGLFVNPLAIAKIAVVVVLLFFAVFVGLLKMGLWYASTRTATRTMRSPLTTTRVCRCISS
jgi:uncharacterized protein YacL